jgi:hypothetical protein
VYRSFVALLVLAGCSAQSNRPSRPPEPVKLAPVASRPAKKAPKASESKAAKECARDEHYDEAELAILLDADETNGSRFRRSEHGACGDATLTLTDDGRTLTLSATRAGKTAVVLSAPSDFVVLEGCVDITGDGAPELVIRRPGGGAKPSSTEVVSLEAIPKSLFKTTLELALEKTRHGPFAYELVGDGDADGYTLPRLPVVVAHRAGRFARIGATERDYWLGRRREVKQALECELRSKKPLSRAFVNEWFAESLYVGDWDEEKKQLPLDATLELDLAFARPILENGVRTEPAGPVAMPNSWLLTKDAPAEVQKALTALAALPALPVTTEETEPVLGEDQGEPPPPPGFRALGTPKDNGALLERCGTYVVEQVRDESSLSVRLRDAEGRYVGRILPEFSTGSASAEWCLDLTGDRVPELLVTEGSGGAHCCQKYRVLSLGAAPELLLEFDAGNGWLEGPENLDGQGPYELVGRDDLLTLDASASPYSGTYFLPIVFVLEKGKYVRRTRRFKSLLKSERDRLLAEYREDDPRGLTSDPSGFMALSLLLADWDKVKSRLPIDPTVRVWFDPEITIERIRPGLEP